MSENSTTGASGVTPSTPSHSNCDWWVAHGKDLEGNPDIAGIGVIIAFMTSACLTLLVIFVAYVTGEIDENLLRPVDTLVHGLCRWEARRKKSIHKHRRLRKALAAFVLSLSDQQVLTGMAILIAGFVGMARDVAVYHFQIVIYMGWMASSVNLSAITMLSRYFRAHLVLMRWRILGMTALLILLLVSLAPTASNIWMIANYNWDNTTAKFEPRMGVPARCYFFKNHGQGINPDAPFAMSILLVSYIWKVASLFSSSRGLFRRYLRRPWERLLERFLNKRAATKMQSSYSWRNPCSWLSLYNPAMVLYVFGFAHSELASSFAASLHLSWIGLMFGSFEVLVPRFSSYIQDSSKNNKNEDNENAWGFGQIVPIVLLIQPFAAVFEAWKKDEKEETQDKDEGFDSQDSQVSNTPSKISDLLATIDLAVESQEPDYLLDHQKAIYRSRIFKALIWWTEFGGVCVVVLVFLALVVDFGIDPTTTVPLLIVAVPLVMTVSVLLLLVSIPFSRLYR